jgi:hypothetical protein
MPTNANIMPKQEITPFHHDYLVVSGGHPTGARKYAAAQILIGCYLTKLHLSLFMQQMQRVSLEIRWGWFGVGTRTQPTSHILDKGLGEKVVGFGVVQMRALVHLKVENGNDPTQN